MFATILDMSLLEVVKMQSNIDFAVLEVNGKTVYQVNDHYFEIIFHCDPIPITQDMLKNMFIFAEEEKREDNKSFPHDAIPFEIWNNDDFVAW
jgi:hypothetical protein